jgi:hypothetical protein
MRRAARRIRVCRRDIGRGSDRGKPRSSTHGH